MCQGSLTWVSIYWVAGGTGRRRESGVLVLIGAFFAGLAWKFMYGEGAWQVAE